MVIMVINGYLAILVWLLQRKISTLNFTGQPFQTTGLAPSRRTYLEPDFTRGINEKS